MGWLESKIGWAVSFPNPNGNFWAASRFDRLTSRYIYKLPSSSGDEICVFFLGFMICVQTLTNPPTISYQQFNVELGMIAATTSVYVARGRPPGPCNVDEQFMPVEVRASSYSIDIPLS